MARWSSLELGGEFKRGIFIDGLHTAFVQDPAHCQLEGRLLATRSKAKLWSGATQTMRLHPAVGVLRVTRGLGREPPDTTGSLLKKGNSGVLAPSDPMRTWNLVRRGYHALSLKEGHGFGACFGLY